MEHEAFEARPGERSLLEALVIGRSGASWRDALELGRLVAGVAIAAVVLGPALVLLQVLELLEERRRRAEEAAAEAAWADAPYVCPGCYAVGEQECASWCPDAEIERERAYDEACGPRCPECGQYECFVHDDEDDDGSDEVGAW
jgi:TPP-dependent indolepyruvate ferredoxin oxidoreductase alpha subunit